ncbi:hypothetical protein [Paenibacillus sp. SN-8-1]|uniref:hypothetical protein n=1 Tax=Paenibacillus sp. SN-8-1 TaxID=3435409 RepID=UPI003D9A1CEB
MENTDLYLSELDRRVRDELAELQAQIDQLKAENARLRTALLKASASPSKMSSKLRDALYE